MIRKTIGLTTRVVLFGTTKKEVVGRVDTGATKSSIDVSLAREIGVGPALKLIRVKSAHGTRQRPLIIISVEIAGEQFDAEFTIADREHMKYPLLIGQNILKRFLIDPLK